jgi:peptidyl-prolyl cis-trans isomerase C
LKRTALSVLLLTISCFGSTSTSIGDLMFRFSPTLSAPFLALATAAALALTLPLAAQAQNVADDPVLVVVDGMVTITKSDLQDAYAQLSARRGDAAPPEVVLGQLMERLVVRAAILSRALAAEDELIALPEVQQQLQDAREDVLLQALLTTEIEARINPENLAAAYEAFRAANLSVREVRASHILVDDEALAVSLIEQINSGADFAALATKYSRDSGSGQRGGDLDFFTAEQMVPAFSQAAFALEVGAHTIAPVQSRFGYHVIQVTDQRTRPTPSFSEVADQLRSELSASLLQTIVTEIRAAATVEQMEPTPE